MFSEALILESTNPQYDKIVRWSTSSVHENYKLRTCRVHKLFLFWYSEQFMYTTCSQLVLFMYWTGKSKNNLLSYGGLVDVRINASDKDLPVLFQTLEYKNFGLVQKVPKFSFKSIDIEGLFYICSFRWTNWNQKLKLC